ncbi:MAG: hypothetical protein LC808_27435 [Actinobacteria bacterium]|nr:hypothetical protein [Actinomycetota bacterium]
MHSDAHPQGAVRGQLAQ